MSILTVALLTVVVILSLVALPIIILALTNKAVEKKVDNKKETTTKKNRSWISWTISGIILFVVLWQFVSFLMAVGITAIIAGIVFLFTKKKKTETDKKKEPPKNKPRLHFWIEPSTLVMILFGYVFFTMAYTNGMFDGAILTIKMPVESLSGIAYMENGVQYMARYPKEGYLYVPYFGLLVSFLLGGFLSLLDRSKIGAFNLMGVLFLPTIFGVWALANLWFMPFMQPHFVSIPIISEIPLVNLLQNFPADPQLPKWLIFFTITGLMYIAPRLPGIRYYYNTTFIRAVILGITVIMFGEQMVIYRWFTM